MSSYWLLGEEAFYLKVRLLFNFYSFNKGRKNQTMFFRLLLFKMFENKKKKSILNPVNQIRLLWQSATVQAVHVRQSRTFSALKALHVRPVHVRYFTGHLPYIYCPETIKKNGCLFVSLLFYFGNTMGIVYGKCTARTCTAFYRTGRTWPYTKMAVHFALYVYQAS